MTSVDTPPVFITWLMAPNIFQFKRCSLFSYQVESDFGNINWRNEVGGNEILLRY